MNKVVIMGRLTASPELRQTTSGVAVTEARVAVNRRFANADGTYSADYFTVVAWRKTAEFICKHFVKGRMIAVVGSLQNREFTDKNGNKRTVTEIIADEVHFCGDGKPGGEARIPEAPAYKPAEAGDLEEADDDDELPF